MDLRWVSVVLASLLLATGVAASAASGFTDVPDDHIFAAQIEWLADEGITRGCNPPANDTFCPDDVVTRGQMAAFLVRALDLSDVDPELPVFVDAAESVFVDDIMKLASAGITRGCNPPTNDMFCPSDPVTRGQMAAFLVRALNLTEADPDAAFVDVTTSVFKSSIAKLATAGITRGCNPPTNDMFCPNDPVTRGQMAAFLHRGLTVRPQISPHVLTDATVGEPYEATFSARWGLAPYSWSATGVPAGLLLRSDGVLAGTPTEPSASSFALTVTDNRGYTDTDEIPFEVDLPLEITTDELPRWTVDQHDSAQLTSTGGSPPYEWEATGLPQGINIDASGRLEGTPAEIGESVVTFTVVDGDDRLDNVSILLEVLGEFHIVTVTYDDGTVGEDYSDIAEATGGLPPYTWEAVAPLPEGLTISAVGEISGVPTTSGSFFGSLRVTDAAGQTDEARAEFEVYEPLEVVTADAPIGTVGEWYELAFVATGGKAPLVWSGEMPPGLSLAADGTLSGTPATDGDAGFTVSVADAGGRTAQRYYLVEIRHPVSIATSSLPDATANDAYSTQLAAAGGQPPYVWSLLSTPFPSDISDDGLLTSMPRKKGEFNLTVGITDASGRTGQRTFLLDVDGRLWIEPDLADEAAYTFGSQLLTAYGGEPPFVWSGTSLPSGLSLSPDGMLSGTPAEPGVQEVTVTVTDDDGRVVTAYLDMFVSGMALVSRTPSGEPGNGACIGAAISGDGRYVVVECEADNFVPGDSNGLTDAYRHDRETGEMLWVSPDTTGERTSGVSGSVIDFDGDVIGFSTSGDGVIPGDDNGWGDVFVYTTDSGSLVRISEGPGGIASNRHSGVWAISDNGRWVNFGGGGDNLVVPDTNGWAGDSFLYDFWTGDLTIEGRNEAGSQPAYGAQPWDLSGDGRFVVFGARGPEFDPRQTVATAKSVFLRDTVTGDVSLVSDTYNGNLMTSGAYYAVLDYDGSYVAYLSASDDILQESVDGRGMVYQYEVGSGITRLVSRSTTGARLDSDSGEPYMSGNGRFVAYYTLASNGSPVGNNITEAYVWDMHTDSTIRLSLTPSGHMPNGRTAPVGISADGAWVVVLSEASDLVPGDTNGVIDVFVAAVDNR